MGCENCGGEGCLGGSRYYLGQRRVHHGVTGPREAVFNVNVLGPRLETVQGGWDLGALLVEGGICSSHYTLQVKWGEVQLVTSFL